VLGIVVVPAATTSSRPPRHRTPRLDGERLVLQPFGVKRVAEALVRLRGKPRQHGLRRTWCVGAHPAHHIKLDACLLGTTQGQGTGDGFARFG
jgi:hypothetical protein